MKWAKVLWVIAGLLLAGYIWQNQTLKATNTKLDKVQTNIKQRQARLVTQQKNQVELPEFKADKEKQFNEANDNVKQIMQSVVGTDPRQFNTTLAGKVTPGTISSLRSELTPTVSTSQFDSQNVVYVGVVNKFDDPLNFLVIAKNETQQNAFYVTYDLASHEITRVDRAAIKGAFNEYK